MDGDFRGPTDGAPGSAVQILSSSGSSVEIPEGVALFECGFARDGTSLVLSSGEGTVVRIEGYFINGTPDLVAANGAVLSGAQVVTLAGARADMLIAQDGGFAAPQPIGQVESQSGRAFAQRADGSRVELQQGDSIYQKDVLITEAASTISVTFVDGTIFTLAETSRMIIDELIYDPGGDDNSGVFNLVQGGFVFIAGQVAKTGDMDVNTPSATMGIRGTTVTVEIEVVNGEAIVRVALNPDPDGAIGTIELTDLTGDVISVITDTNTQWYVSPGGAEQQIRTPEQLAEDQELISLVSNAFRAVQSSDQSGGSDEGGESGNDGANGGGEGESEEGDAGEGDGEEQGEAGDGDGEAGDEANLAPPPGPAGDTGLTPAGGPAPQTVADGGGAGAPGGGVAGQGITAARVIIVVNDQSPIVAQTATAEFAEDSAGASVALAVQGLKGAGVSFALIDSTLPDPDTEAVITNFDPATGTFDIIPAANFFGDLVIGYRAVSSDNRVDDGVIRITVTPLDDAPELAQTEFAGLEDIVASVDLDITDIDSDPSQYQLRLSGAPSSGQAALSEDGQLTLTPVADQSGPVSIAVDIVDGDQVLSSATVVVTFAPVPDAPQLETAVIAAVEDGGPVTLDLTALGQDADPEDDGGTLTYEVLSQPAEGHVTITDGVLTFDPGTAFQDLDAGDVRDVEFNIRAVDSTGLSVVQQMTARVTGSEDAPVPASADALALIVTEDGGLQQFDLLGAAQDVDGDSLSVAVTSVLTDAGQPVTYMLEAGILSVDPAQFNDLDTGESVSVAITYTIDDGDSDPVEGTASLIVTGLNDAPEPGQVPDQTVTETGVPVVFDLLGAATDAEGDDLTLSILGVQDQSGADIAFAVAGGRVVIDRAQFDNLQQGVQSDVVIRYAISDGKASPVEAETHLIVTGEADGPTISASAPTGFVEADVAQTQSLTDTGTVTLGDVDTGDLIDLSAVSNNDISWSGGSLDPALAAALVAGFTAQAVDALPGDAAWTYASAALNLDFLNAGDKVSWSYTLSATDSTGKTAQTEVKFTLTGTGDVPVVTGDTAGVVTEDTVTSTSGRLTLSDPDAQGATFVAATDVQGKYGQLMINADGDWTYFLNNALDAVQALGAGETLRDVITVATTDGTTHDIDITVSGLDEPPSFDDWVIAGADASSADGPTVTLVSTGTGDVSVSEAEAFLGLADGALTQAIGGSVFTGSVASADVTVSPGSALKFTFDLTGEDGQFAGFPDAAFVVINGEVTVLGTLGGSEIFDAQTNLTLPSGSYSVGFGVFDVNDNAFAATLSVTELVIGPPGDPIVLDLDGDGVELGGAARFDLDADGAAETLGWVSGGDGLLVVDRDGSGVIEDGREVLSEQFDGFGFGNSVEALRALDTNLDGQVDARDAGFDDLLVWRDQDGDGQTDIGELISLDDLDITSLSVTPESTDKIRDGQVVFAEGAFTYSDGREGLYAGVRFQEQTEPSDLIQPDPILAEGGAVQPRDFGGQAELLDILAQEADAVVEVPSA